MKDIDKLRYAAVSQRRSGFDTMLWQVPALAFAAMAVMLSVVVGQASTLLARLVAAGFAVGVALLAVSLMERHRQADNTDASWLAAFEVTHGISPGEEVHGESWRTQRNVTGLASESSRTPQTNQLKLWILALRLAAGAFILLAIASGVWPPAFTNDNDPRPIHGPGHHQLFGPPRHHVVGPLIPSDVSSRLSLIVQLHEAREISDTEFTEAKRLILNGR